VGGGARGHGGDMGRWKIWAALGAAVVGLSGCWPAPGAGPNRQSFNGLEQAITVDNVDTFAEVWRAQVGGSPDPSVPPSPAPAGDPVVSTRGVLYISSRSSLHAFDPRTGAPRWYRNLTLDPADTQVISLPDDRVLVGWGSARFGISLLATDGLTGAPLPPVPRAMFADSTRGSWLASTLIREEQTPFRYHRALRVLRLDDPTQGWEGWIDATADGVTSTRLTVATDRVLYAGPGLMSAAPGSSTFGNAVRSFPLAGGLSDCGPADMPYYACPQWITPIDGTVGSSPVLSDDGATLYTVTDAGTVYAVDTATGAVEWSGSVGAGVLQPPALAYGTLFVPTVDGSLVAVDAADGSVEWSTAGASELTVQPAVAGGVVFTGAADGTVAAYDVHGCGAATCGELWSDNAGSRITGAPAISLGKVFVGTEDGRVIAYGPTN
jgi:outer membrane protein assembly factor BamB